MFSKAKAANSGETAAGRHSSGVPTVISPDLTIEGNLKSDGDIQLDGVVDGDVETRTLTVGEDGTVHGSVTAETVRICGKVDGEVRAGSVSLARTAEVRGDVVHDSLAIEAGAFIDGRCRPGNREPATAEHRGSSHRDAGDGETATSPATAEAKAAANGHDTGGGAESAEAARD